VARTKHPEHPRRGHGLTDHRPLTDLPACLSDGCSDGADWQLQPIVPVAGQPPVSKLEAFRLVRRALFTNFGANAAGTFPVFDNAFTTCLGFAWGG
jgi:hypothetical protein